MITDQHIFSWRQKHKTISKLNYAIFKFVIKLNIKGKITNFQNPKTHDKANIMQNEMLNHQNFCNIQCFKKNY